MALTADEITVVNQAIDKIGALTITVSSQASTEGIKANTHYAQTRDSLLRSYDWNFAIEQANLVVLNTIIVDVAPTVAWVAGDTLVGMTSDSIATILTVVSTTEYVVSFTDGTFVVGEAVKTGVASSYQVTYESSNVTYEGSTVYSYEIDSEFVSIAELAPLFDYNHQYKLPEDFLRLTKNYHGDKHWTIQRNRLLSWNSTVNIEYIKKVTDPNEFDPLFSEVLILQLALKLINPVAGTGTSSLKQSIMQDLKIALNAARTVCRDEKNTTGSSDWNSVRYTSGKIRTHF